MKWRQDNFTQTLTQPSSGEFNSSIPLAWSQLSICDPWQFKHSTISFFLLTPGHHTLWWQDNFTQYLKIPSSSEINSSSPLTWLTRHLWPTAVFWLNPTTLFAHFNSVHNIKCNFTPNFNPKLHRVNSTAFFDHLELHQTKIAPLFPSAWGINPGYNIKCCQELIPTPQLNKFFPSASPVPVHQVTATPVTATKSSILVTT